jgi:putative ABC transport system ATP-binding protein
MRPLPLDRAAPVVLELEDVTKSYPGEPPVTALASVSLAIAEGDLVAIVGPSGSASRRSCT